MSCILVLSCLSIIINCHLFRSLVNKYSEKNSGLLTKTLFNNRLSIQVISSSFRFICDRTRWYPFNPLNHSFTTFRTVFRLICETVVSMREVLLHWQENYYILREHDRHYCIDKPNIVRRRHVTLGEHGPFGQASWLTWHSNIGSTNDMNLFLSQYRHRKCKLHL